MHTRVAVTEPALGAVEIHQADCTLALGGGFTVGLGKAIARGAPVLPSWLCPRHTRARRWPR